MVTFSSSTHWSFSATITVIVKIHLYRLAFSTHASQDAPRDSLLLGNEGSETDGLISMTLANTGSMTHANAEVTASQIQGLNANWCRRMTKEELSKLSTSIESLKTMIEGTKIGMW